MDPQFNLNGGGKKKRVFLTLKEKLQAAALYREHWRIINGYAVADEGWTDDRVIAMVRPGAGSQAFKDIRWAEVGKNEKEATRKTQGHGVAGGMAAARANKMRTLFQEQIDNLVMIITGLRSAHDHLKADNAELREEIREIKARLGGFMPPRESPRLYPT